MISLLRKVRKRLLSQDNFTSYLIYAIGEIALVVIGILIALQINNWNEGRKLKALEKTSLSELESSLQDDIDNLESLISLYDGYFKKIEILRDHIAAKKANESFLDTLWVAPVFGYHFRPNISAFQALENRGVELVSNKLLRDQITKHYNVTQAKMVNSFDFMEELQKQFMHYYFDLVYPHPQMEEVYIKNYNPDLEIQLPGNYEEILEDKKIIGELNHRMNANFRMIHFMKEFIQTKLELKEAIGEDLKN